MKQLILVEGKNDKYFLQALDGREISIFQF